MRSIAKICFAAILTLLLVSPALSEDEWLPINKEDLAMKDFAPEPGLHAVLLYHSVDRNDRDGKERQYYRIKIFDEEGKKYANVEIEPIASRYRMRDIKARTIKPDGSVVNFDGKVFDKTIKFKGFNLVSKTFTLPDVQVGSIIEYRYDLSWDASSYIFDSRWVVQDTLFTRDAVFKLKPSFSGYNISWGIFFLNPLELPKQDPKSGEIVLTVQNFPAFEKEAYMPPEEEARSRVEFYYTYGKPETNSDEYWKNFSKGWTESAESFMDRRKAADRVASEVVAASDTSEQKLVKLYAYVQKLRNLTYERSKSEKEQKVEKLKDNNNVEDVLKHGYGYHNQLVRTFTALARAFGADATLVRVQERDQSFFHKDLRQADKLDTELTLIKLGGKEVYVDAGIPFCPYGVLSWEDTGVTGLALNKAAPLWVQTPTPPPDLSLIRRMGTLTLDREGNLAGEITVRFEGQDALRRRLLARDDDDAGRKKDLQDLVKQWVPANSSIELQKIDSWDSSADTFQFTATLNIPGFASATGKRMIVPVSVFAGSDAHPFTHVKRVHPVYFRVPFSEMDEVKIKLPEGFQLETMPKSKQVPRTFADFTVDTTFQEGTITVSRALKMKGNFFVRDYYPSLREFLDQVKAVSDEQAILRVASK